MGNITNRAGFKIAIIFLLGVMAAMTVSEAVTELGAIARDFHSFNPTLIGLVMSLPSLVVAVGALAAGYLVDRIGDRPILITGAAIAVLGDLCVIAAPTMNLLLAARLVEGVGYVLAAVGSITILMRITSGKQRTMGLALWSTAVPVSFILPFLTAGLAVHFATWRAAFVAHAIATAVLLVLALVSLPESDVNRQVSRTQGLAAVVRSPKPYLLGLSFGSNALLLSGMTATIGPYLFHRYGMSEMRVQYLNIIAMVLTAASSLLVGRWLNRGISAVGIGVTGIVLTLISGCLMFGVALGGPGSIAAFWVFTFGSGLLVGMWALVPRCAPSSNSMGATSGLVTQLTLIGVLLGTPLAFAAQSAATPAPMLALVIVVSLLCLAGGAPIWRSAKALQAPTLSGGPSAVGAE